MVEILTPLTTLLSGGTVIYLVVSKLFSIKNDRAIAHNTEVTSFEKEMSVIRNIHLEFLNDINQARESLKKEQVEEDKAMTGKISELNTKIAELKLQLSEEQKTTRSIEGQYLLHLTQMNETIQSQSTQISKMAAFLHLLCDKECDERHTPNCPML